MFVEVCQRPGSRSPINQLKIFYEREEPPF